MRLSSFLNAFIEQILMEWESFAETLVPAATGMTSLALRDHARQILGAVAMDLQTDQTEHERSEQSKGKAVPAPSAPETAAQTHALLRAKEGFDINQLIAEYRALRASVLRMYFDAGPDSEFLLDDVVRFNEAIDQAITESVTFFDAQMQTARNLLLGMLGHDMRSPLSSIVMTAKYLAAINAGEKISEAAGRLIRSGEAIQHLLDDLVDFSRNQLGLGMTIAPTDADLSVLAIDEVQRLRAAYPNRRIELEISGDTKGRWDGRRLQQLIRNLVCNALVHGANEAPVTLTVAGLQREVVCEVANAVPAIDDATIRRIFRPLERAANKASHPEADIGLGLGLYIVDHIAKAHGGEVTVRSTDAETVFKVTLPRYAEPATPL